MAGTKREDGDGRLLGSLKKKENDRAREKGEKKGRGRRLTSTDLRFASLLEQGWAGSEYQNALIVLAE